MVWHWATDMSTPMPSLREKGGILLVCGESSGDQIAAAMLRELRR
ncbi:MAG: hypothetical protein KC488_07140, partial [Candidatus Cloacimonetes bacterium]|nr:hypothetical protein [Candidatus Cloacimonadota bacterium]